MRALYRKPTLPSSHAVYTNTLAPRTSTLLRPLASRRVPPPHRLLRHSAKRSERSPFRAEGVAEADAGAAPLVTAAGDRAVRVAHKLSVNSCTLPPSHPSPIAPFPHRTLPPSHPSPIAPFPHRTLPPSHPFSFPRTPHFNPAHPSPTSPFSATRSGLFRSPVSRGAESATSAHSLPAPAVAVRNLERLSATRSGLFHSPVSGGVESATSAHGLPAPAVAVAGRNSGSGGAGVVRTALLAPLAPPPQGAPLGVANPMFLLSPLGMHSRNLLLSEPRCTVVAQVPGRSGLANARATIFGGLYPLPSSQQVG
ncbi:unnamed protein product [Closterium sp. Naga37s-1]|nr:unnamed protein product [Closterium sp. Naga37s-1]